MMIITIIIIIIIIIGNFLGLGKTESHTDWFRLSEIHRWIQIHAD
jgi:hypothetical protein